MSLRLVLTRHAKSDWDNPLQSDHERPLNQRGRRAAPLIGRWLVENGYLPDEAFVSDAARTCETWARLSAEFPQPVSTHFEPALYHASPDTMLRVLQTAQGDTVMMIGHNPGIAAFAARLLRTPPKEDAFARYPTCATLVADFPAEHWRDIRPQTGALCAFIIPRALE